MYSCMMILEQAQGNSPKLGPAHETRVSSPYTARWLSMSGVMSNHIRGKLSASGGMKSSFTRFICSMLDYFRCSDVNFMLPRVSPCSPLVGSLVVVFTLTN